MTRLLRGTSIIEIVIATALISVAIIATLSLANHSQKQNSYAKYVAEATTYTRQAVDWLRSERDSLGWELIAQKALSDAVGGIATYCLNSLPTAGDDFGDLIASSCTVGSFISNTFYTRELIINTASKDAGILKVTVSVTWQDKIERQSTVETELTSWQ